MRDIYYYLDSPKTYIKLGVGEGRFDGMFLWQEVKKFLWFYIPTKNKFWLDEYGFTKLVNE